VKVTVPLSVSQVDVPGGMTEPGPESIGLDLAAGALGRDEGVELAPPT
jgi:hypothetical protein